MVGWCFDVVTVVVVVVVVDSVSLELDDVYPDGDKAGGVTLLDGTYSMSSRRFSSFAGVGGLFLTGLKAY